MSNRYLTPAFKADLAPNLKFTLVALCDAVDEDGSWKLRYETLAEKTGQSRRAIMGHIKTLTEMKVVSIEKTRREDGRQGANRFTVDHEKLCQIQSADNDKSQSADDCITETQSESDDISRVQMASFQSEANDTPSTLTSPQEFTLTPPHSPPVDDFERLWCVWQPFDMPKGEKQIARKSWSKHVVKTGADPATVIAQAQAYCAEARRYGKKTKHIQTWLNNSLWLEDYSPPVSGADQVKAALQEKWRREDERDEAGNLRIGDRTAESRLHAAPQSRP